MDEEPPGVVSEWYGVSVAPTLRTGSPVGANLESAGASFPSLLLVSGPRSGVSWGHGHSRGRVAGPCPAVDSVGIGVILTFPSSSRCQVLPGFITHKLTHSVCSSGGDRKTGKSGMD